MTSESKTISDSATAALAVWKALNIGGHLTGFRDRSGVLKEVINGLQHPESSRDSDALWADLMVLAAESLQED